MLNLANIFGFSGQGRFPFVGTGRSDWSVRKWNARVLRTVRTGSGQIGLAYGVGPLSSPGPARNEEIVREYYALKMEAGPSQTCGLENEEKLATWSSKSTKLLISLRREKTDLFDNGKVRRKVAWDKVAEQFNGNSSVRVTGEQCANKWKKLEEKYKKVREHNAKTGSDKKECEFEDEIGNNNLFQIAVCSVSFRTSMLTYFNS